MTETRRAPRGIPVVRCGMQQSHTVPDAERTFDRRSAFRVAVVDGRQARLVDRDRTLTVRILDESSGGFRIAAVDACSLPNHTCTVLRLGESEIPVRIVYKRLEGPRTMIGLQRLPI